VKPVKEWTSTVVTLRAPHGSVNAQPAAIRKPITAAEELAATFRGPRLATSFEYDEIDSFLDGFSSRSSIPSPRASKPMPAPASHTKRPAAKASGAVIRERLLATIRAGAGWVGGYAVVFGDRDRRGECFGPASMNTARYQNILVHLDHQGPVLASVDAGTALVDLDVIGLWIESNVADPKLFGRVRGGEAKLSIGWSDPVTTRSGVIARVGRVHEVSIIVPPSTPRFRGTWLAPGAEALTRRSHALALHRR